MLRTTYLHSNWQFIEKSWPSHKVGTTTPEWLPATVPGHVHLDLVANGIIADPHVRMNELGCQWVDLSDWSYRCSFDWSLDPDNPRRVLVFEGLDTVCEIFLNGEKVADHDNMFVPLEVDVTDRLVEGSNELRVDFQSAVRVGEERRAAYFAKEGLGEEVLNFPERAFVRKAQYMFGWDWGPRLVSCGIWRPVKLVEFKARILDVSLSRRWQNGRVTFSAASTTEGEGVVVHEFGEQRWLVGDGSIEVPASVIWSDEDPSTFTWRSYLVPEDKEGLDTFERPLPKESEERLVSKVVRKLSLELDASSVWECTVGCSAIRLLREPDRFGESFEFEVNGEKIWARGANWIPDHSFPSVVDKARLRDRLEKAKDMGFNMLRVWGGGLYETDEFYDLCDELGILVWQDFPFACSYYPDDEHWQEVIRREAEVNIRRIRNHPCLALWCGNNENLEMYVNAWGGVEKRPPRYYGENHYDDVLPKLVEELDPKTSYVATSPIGTPPEDSATNEKQRGPNSGGYGDQHCWDVWHGRGDWRHYADSTGRFSSEYGFASSCCTSLWAKTLEEEDWDPHSPVVKWHDKTGKGHDVFHGYVKLHYPEPVTLEDWVYYSQLNQRDALRFGVEHYRRSEFCKGSLIWQLNDCWPAQSWAILDSDGNYKALAYELRRLYDDLLVSIVRDNDQVTIWVANDGYENVEGLIRLEARNSRTGELAWERYSETLNLKGGQRLAGLQVSIAGLSVPETILFAGFNESTAWQLLGEPKDARLAGPSPLTVSTYEDGLLLLKCESPIVDLMLTDNGSPAPFHDNFLTVAEAGVYEIRLNHDPSEILARSLAGEHRISLTRSPLR